ncbi:MAG: hydroxyacid dehydrogenase [Ruminococcaceae bacterium]|nr:hydroxyacid dehydrogenase [Oscillospiraceae bacterium]
MKALVAADRASVLNRGHNNPEFQFFPEENIKKIESLFDEVIWNETGRDFTEEEFLEKVRDVDAIFTSSSKNKINKKVLDNAPKLKIVAHLMGSVANIVTEDVFDAGIKVIGTNDGIFAESVAEATLLYILMSNRCVKNVLDTINNVGGEEGWTTARKIVFRRGLMGRSVGLVSFGAITEHLARMLQPFHCKIKVYSRSISEEKLRQYNMERASLEEIFSTCDVISLHTAWTKQTEGMITRELLHSIKDNALLVNTARGMIVDEPALIDELKTGRFRAVLDVTINEPPEYEKGGLYDLPNVILMPHHGGPTADRYPLIAAEMIDEVYAYLAEGKIPAGEFSRERINTMTI